MKELNEFILEYEISENIKISGGYTLSECFSINNYHKIDEFNNKYIHSSKINKIIKIILENFNIENLVLNNDFSFSFNVDFDTKNKFDIYDNPFKEMFIKSENIIIDKIFKFIPNTNNTINLKELNSNDYNCIIKEKYQFFNKDDICVKRLYIEFTKKGN